MNTQIAFHDVTSVKLSKVMYWNGNTHQIVVTMKDYNGKEVETTITFYGEGASALGGLEKTKDFRNVPAPSATLEKV